MEPSYKTIIEPRQWSATIGMSKENFFELCDLFEKSYVSIFGVSIEERKSNTTMNVKMQTYEDLLFFVLFSLKSGLTYDALGFVFNLRGSHARKIQQFGLRILKACLHKKGVIPKRFFKNQKQFKELLKEEEILQIDGTEQIVQRPKNQEEQKDFYSGKKNSYRKNNCDKQS